MFREATRGQKQKRLKKTNVGLAKKSLRRIPPCEQRESDMKYDDDTNQHDFRCHAHIPVHTYSTRAKEDTLQKHIVTASLLDEQHFIVQAKRCSCVIRVVRDAAGAAMVDGAGQGAPDQAIAGFPPPHAREAQTMRCTASGRTMTEDDDLLAGLVAICERSTGVWSIILQRLGSM